jgi:hypothetical protein
MLPVNPAVIEAAFLRSETKVTCEGVIEGRSEIVGLRFGGMTVAVSTAPSQTISIPGVATLVINEQRVSMSGGVTELSVNAIHLTLVTGEEVILSHAESYVSGCGVGPCHDFVTGGGFTVNGGKKQTFSRLRAGL